MPLSGISSLLVLAIILLGAYKVYLAAVHTFLKLFKKANPEHVERFAFITIGVTILIMVVPLLIPFGGPMRMIVLALYAVYGIGGLVQIWHWFGPVVDEHTKK